jgi:MoxR-like ATPase
MTTNNNEGKILSREMMIPKHNDNLIVTDTVEATMDAIEKLQAMLKPTLLVGHAGVGKNQLIGEVANKLRKPVIKINCSGDMRTSSLLGRMAPNNEGKFVWEDGLIIKAIREGYWLILDEINCLDADILFCLHGLIDDGFITLANNSEVVEAHPEFRMFATMNPISYFGVKTLNQALADRFAIIEVGFDKEIDKALVKQLNYPKEIQTSLLTLITNIRMEYEKGEISQNFGHRTLSNVVQLSKEFDLLDSLNMSFSNKLPDTQRASIKTLFKDLATMVQAQKPVQTTKKGAKAVSQPAPTGGQVVNGVDVDSLIGILSDGSRK